MNYYKMLYSLTVYKAHGVVELEHPGSLHVKRPSQRTKSELYSPMDIATSLAREVRAPLPNLDTIYLRNLRLSANVGPDAWGRFGKSQPIVINLQLHLDTSKSGASDDLQHSFSYGQMYKDVITTIDGKDLTVICGIRQSICEVASKWPGNSIHCSITLPKSLLGVDEGLGLHFQITRPAEKGWKFSGAQWSIKGLKTACIIGLNEHERHEKQTVNVDVEFLEDYESWFRRDAQPDNWRGLVKTLHEVSCTPYRF